MSVTQDELLEFNKYATEKLRAGHADSLEELLLEWRLVRERNEVNAAIRRGIADVDAGRSRPLSEVWDDFAAKHNSSDTSSEA